MIPWITIYIVIIAIFSFFIYLYQLKLNFILAFVQFTWPFMLLTIFAVEYRYFYIRKKLQRHDYRRTDALTLDQLYLDELQQLKQKVNDEHNRELLSQKEREDYIRLWSHEIKTPLTRIKLILENHESDINEALNKQILIIQNQLDLLLTYERLKSFNTDLHFKKVDLKDECNRCLKNLMEMAVDKDIIVQNRLEKVTYLTDQKWIEVIIEQILLNAIKYSHPGGQIIIEGENNILKVIDNGIGISAEDLPEIFKAGYIGKNARQSNNASGLGLYLVKQICQKLEIKIKIQSTEGHGTVVNLYLSPKLIPK